MSSAEAVSQATRYLLHRLDALAAVPETDPKDVATMLLAIPEEKREHVLAVLADLSNRAPVTGLVDLAEGARLILNAARELWKSEPIDNPA